jgi:hypothetical protein
MVAMMEHMSGLREEIKEMGGLGDNVGITDQEKQQAYALGYQFFQQKKYDKAMTVFEALNVLDPLNVDFSKAIAVTLQAQDKPSDAAIQFMITYFFHQDDLSLALHAGRCMVEAKGPLQAYLVLRSIVEAKRYPETPANIRFREMIMAMLEGLGPQVESMARAEEKNIGTAGEGQAAGETGA